MSHELKAQLIGWLNTPTAALACVGFVAAACLSSLRGRGRGSR